MRNCLNPDGEIRALGSAVVVLGPAPKPTVDVTPWFCTTGFCPAVVGDMVVYRDDNHLTTAYSRWLAPALQPALTSALSRSRS